MGEFPVPILFLNGHHAPAEEFVLKYVQPATYWLQQSVRAAPSSPYIEVVSLETFPFDITESQLLRALRLIENDPLYPGSLLFEYILQKIDNCEFSFNPNVGRYQPGLKLVPSLRSPNSNEKPYNLFGSYANTEQGTNYWSQYTRNIKLPGVGDLSELRRAGMREMAKYNRVTTHTRYAIDFENAVDDDFRLNHAMDVFTLMEIENDGRRPHTIDQVKIIPYGRLQACLNTTYPFLHPSQSWINSPVTGSNFTSDSKYDDEWFVSIYCNMWSNVYSNLPGAYAERIRLTDPERYERVIGVKLWEQQSPAFVDFISKYKVGSAARNFLDYRAYIGTYHPTWAELLSEELMDQDYKQKDVDYWRDMRVDDPDVFARGVTNKSRMGVIDETSDKIRRAMHINPFGSRTALLRPDNIMEVFLCDTLLKLRYEDQQKSSKKSLLEFLAPNVAPFIEGARRTIPITEQPTIFSEVYDDELQRENMELKRLYLKTGLLSAQRN